MAQKSFGRPSGSLNAPIAAFTMAVVLCSYCFSSIHTARREAQSSSPPPSNARPQDRPGQSSWVQQALKESRETK